jgi:Sec-independent protein translocase protein TatA
MNPRDIPPDSALGQFRKNIKKLLSISKAELDEQLRLHDLKKRRAAKKTTARRAKG